MCLKSHFGAKAGTYDFAAIYDVLATLAAPRRDENTIQNASNNITFFQLPFLRTLLQNRPEIAPFGNPSRHKIGTKSTLDGPSSPRDAQGTQNGPKSDPGHRNITHFERVLELV